MANKNIQIKNGANNLFPTENLDGGWIASGIYSYKAGVIGIINFKGSNPSFESDGKTLVGTIPEANRPSADFGYVGKVYNGSDYVDCRIAIQTTGKIQILSLYNAAISGALPQYLAPKTFLYFIE